MSFQKYFVGGFLSLRFMYDILCNLSFIYIAIIKFVHKAENSDC